MTVAFICSLATCIFNQNVEIALNFSDFRNYCAIIVKPTINLRVQFLAIWHINFSIDIIDYVTGIGNSSREQYLRAARDNPCRIDLPKKPQKCTKN